MGKKAGKGKTRISRAGTWSNRGFTLIELSLVLLIIGILAAFALPKLGDVGEVRLKSSARHLAGTLQSLFDESVSRKKTYALVYDLSAGSYQGVVESEQGGVVQAASAVRPVTLPGQVRFKDVTTESELRATEGKAVTRFFPEGFSDRTVIHLTDGKKDYTLILMPYSGKVKILEGYVEVSEEEEES